MWTCTNCGEQLYGDDVETTMNQFNGVVWYCDSCGAVLNKQSGFYDSCGTWYCTECGHANPINENEIYESEEAYQNSRKWGYESQNEESGNEVTYECPNCGSVLNCQRCFEENEETYICDSCGTQLYKKWDRYERLYKCPDCGSNLNGQSYFDENEDTYTCDNCDTELYKDGEEYKRLYKCPNCGAVLNDQFIFDDSDDTYTCDCCDTELVKEDERYEILYKCPKCDAILNEQSGFYESPYWTCDECGTDLAKNDNSYEVDLGDNRSECNVEDLESSEKAEESKAKEKSAAFHQPEDNYESSDQHKKLSGAARLIIIVFAVLACIVSIIYYFYRKNGWTSGLILGLLFFIVCICCIVYYEYKKRIPVQFHSWMLLGRSCEDVKKDLRMAGFNRFVEKEIPDLDIYDYENDYKVTNVQIGWKDSFEAFSLFPSNFPVYITFHTLKRITPPFASKSIKGARYKDVERTFTDAGFRNIEVAKLYDIVTGWIKSDGQVKSVTVDGKKRFSEKDQFRPDVKVIITYHTLKKNRPK